uniref:Uncharacterized protein n=1 Tax=Peronospora matthiolae TaxID=2874970 RepID=A0AAV1TTR0_9STRA
MPTGLGKLLQSLGNKRQLLHPDEPAYFLLTKTNSVNTSSTFLEFLGPSQSLPKCERPTRISLHGVETVLANQRLLPFGARSRGRGVTF